MADDREPSSLWLIRHGESAGNVARDRAYAENAAMIDVDVRDMDVPLSARGEVQAHALGTWLGTLADSVLPTAVIASPYVRAQQTARIAMDACGGRVARLPVRTDERLRDRDFGILDRLTGRGIRERYPEQAAQRERFGKFYHRPPGGEAWTDVLLRLRSVQSTLSRELPTERVVIFAHDIVVNCFRYILENMSEREVLDLSDTVEIKNCSVTSFDLRGDTPVLTGFNYVAPLEGGDAPITSESDAAVART